MRAKRSARFGTARIDDLGIDGPFVTGDQFALFLDMLITDPASGQAEPFTEIAIFTVRDGRIKRGDLVVLEAMGGGFTWGASLIRM